MRIARTKANGYAAYTRQRTENILAIIGEYKARTGMSNGDVAQAIGMPLSTFNKRKARPENFRLKEVWLLCEVLGVPGDQRETVM